MGGTSWSSDSYSRIASSHSTKSKDDIFTSTSLASDMSPKGVKFREARDSDAHPESLAINVFLDETGSMGDIPYILVKEKLGALMETIMKHGIPHPAVLFGGIGDHHSDRSPLQVGQFESGTEELNLWLTKIFLEANGGGQDMESYLLAWLFAARHTSIDCFEKRGVKGFLFTIGDERSWDSVDGESLKNLMGYSASEGITDAEILAEAQRTYHVFHIHVNCTGYKDNKTVIGYWRKMLGERCIVLEDYNALAEVIASTVAVMHGVDLKSITANFDKNTAKLVSGALANITSVTTTSKKDGVVKL